MGIRVNPSDRRNKVFVRHVLKVVKIGPQEQELTVIDVPGIFRSHTEEQTTKHDIELVRDMVVNYMKQDMTVILAILPANVDMATQEVLKIARDVDPEGVRTVGVLTKPDLVTERTAKEAVCNLILGKTNCLAHGYYLLRNKGADDGIGFDSHAADDMFNQNPWLKLPRDRIGGQALRKRLGDLTAAMADLAMPNICADVRQQIAACEKHLMSMPPLGTAQERRTFLNDIASNYEKLAHNAAAARYSSDELLLNGTDLRLATHLADIADEFCDTVLARGHTYKFETKEASKSESLRAETIRSAGVFSLTKAQHSIGDLLSMKYDAQEPKKGIRSWLLDHWKHTRGFDVGQFSIDQQWTIFQAQTTNWEDICRAFVSRAIFQLDQFIEIALRSLCPLAHVRKNLRRQLNPELKTQYQAAINVALFLVEIERSMLPMTLSTALFENREHDQQQRVSKKLLKRTTLEYEDCNALHHDEPGPKKRRLDHNAIMDAQCEQGKEDSIVDTLHDHLHAYYQVSRKRLVDNVF